MPKLTNVLGLPDAIVRAVAHDEYTAGDGRISVTSLISPPQLVALRRKHADELTEDASERIWLLLGQCAHDILHRANVDALTELRLSIDVDGWRVSGQFDRLALYPDGLLQDFKVTSSWAVIPREGSGTAGVKPEWEQQLNLYRLLIESHGGQVGRMEIIALLRDWSQFRAKGSATYPQRQVAVLRVPVWDRERAWAYLRERVALHKAAMAGEVPDCTTADQWRRPDTWAHMRKGRKSAIKLHATQADAEHAVEMDVKPGAFVQHRSGVGIRCQSYCPVRSVCPQAQREGVALDEAADVDDAAALMP